MFLDGAPEGGPGGGDCGGFWRWRVRHTFLGLCAKVTVKLRKKDKKTVKSKGAERRRVLENNRAADEDYVSWHVEYDGSKTSRSDPSFIYYLFI